MANIQRVRVEWTGFSGAPGVSTFYCTDASAIMPHLAALFADFLNYMPADVTINFPTSGDTINPLDGSLVSAWTADAQDYQVGSNTGGYAAPTGVMIQWETGTVLDGHRLRGRTFMVPMASYAFTTNGTITTAVLNALRASVTSRLADMAGNLVIWHRPAPGHAGGYSAVSGGTVPNEAVVLRSRRD